MGNPLTEYTKAIRAYERGDLDEAAAHLSTAVGAKETLPVVRQSIDRILSANSPLMPSLLNLLHNENQRG